jgi:hypothetical protein
VGWYVPACVSHHPEMGCARSGATQSARLSWVEEACIRVRTSSRGMRRLTSTDLAAMAATARHRVGGWGV